MNSRIFRNRSTFGFFTPKGQSIINSNELEIYKESILKLKIELNKKNFELQELKVQYNKLNKVYQSNINLLEKLIHESNNNIINTNLSYDNEKEKEKRKEKEKENVKEKGKEINKDSDSVAKINSPKNISKSIETNKNINHEKKSTSFNNNILFLINRNHLNLKLQKEINELKCEISEKDKIIENLNKTASALKYKELDKKYAKMFSELIKTRENNEKLEILCLNLNSKINNYKEKIKKLNVKNTQLEDENYALKKKITKYENQKLYINNESDLNNKSIYSKGINHNEDSQILKEKIKKLEEENKILKEKVDKNGNII